MIGVEGSSGSYLVLLPLHKQGHLGLIAQDHVQTAFEEGDSTVPVVSYPHCERVFLDVTEEASWVSA